jgi:WS/DGAT/MGAT family acyltransferase
MVAPFYEPLSYLDASFLALETRTTHMHVGSVILFEAGPLRREDGGIDVDRIKAHIAGKLKYVPRYRQRLGYVPYNRHPVWIDDDSFNFDYHVRHTSLPRPGSDAQLKALAGRVFSQQLDRSKPLWELWVVEGLEGDRFAMIAKVHHCMIDGLAGVDLTTVMFGLAPSSEIEPADDWEPRPIPTPAELAVAELARTARRLADQVQGLGDVVREGGRLVEGAIRRLAAVGSTLSSGWLTPADRTPLNPEIGPNRRFEWVDLPLDSAKSVKNRRGGTVNDVVLATVAGAVRTFLEEERDFSCDELDFRVMAPVSVRSPRERGRLGNRVAMWLVPLPVSEPDPLTRYEKVKTQTAKLKRTDQALGAATLVELSSGTPIPLLSMANRLVANTVRPFNMTVTNVPGPQFPMYLLESRMLATYPIVPLWAQHGLGVALFSYDGTLWWGLNADYDAVPDVDRFAEAVRRSFGELVDAAAG